MPHGPLGVYRNDADDDDVIQNLSVTLYLSFLTKYPITLNYEIIEKVAVLVKLINNSLSLNKPKHTMMVP